MLTISHLEVEVCWNCVRILQMLMIFFLHVKPKFAQFSAAYLRHVPWAPELFFLSFSGMPRCRGNPPIKNVLHAGYKTPKEKITAAYFLKQLPRA